MYLTYTFLLYAALAAASPYYAIRFRRYLPTLKDRLGFLQIPRLRRTVWIHAVSVGEVRSVQRLVEKLRPCYPGQPIVLSTATPAGQGLARDTAGLADHVFYFPLDLPGSIRRTLDHVDPELVLIAETEIWPNFLRECRRRKIRVLMINGRISDRSLPRYRIVKPWLKRVLKDYTLLGMQSEIDRERIESIGADSAKVTVLGNLKYDAINAARPLEPELTRVLKQCQPLWIAASTTHGEEEQVLAAFAELRTRFPRLTLLLAPRHPERFKEVAQLVESLGLRLARRTEMPGLEINRPVLLLDSIGELASTFEFASVVFMGGTLVPRGGHNILEPAIFSKPIVFGPHMENFREIGDLFIEERAAIQVRNGEELAKAVANLLSDSDAAAELGENARRVVERNAGATEKVLAYLK
jgi:3-deoxy-D-manno-octulosonic-acid transferase